MKSKHINNTNFQFDKSMTPQTPDTLLDEIFDKYSMEELYMTAGIYEEIKQALTLHIQREILKGGIELLSEIWDKDYSEFDLMKKMKELKSQLKEEQGDGE